MSLRAENNGSIMTFRVDEYDHAGNRARSVAVEMSGHTRGHLTDGEEVEVYGRWKQGSLRAERIVNRTTGAEIRELYRWAGRVLGIFAVIFTLVVCGFIAFGFVYTIFFAAP